MFLNKFFLTLLAFFAATPTFASAAAPAFCDVFCHKSLHDDYSPPMPLSIPGAYSINPECLNQKFFDALPRPLAYFLLNKNDNERESALYIYVYDKVRDCIINDIISKVTSEPCKHFYMLDDFLTSNFHAIFGNQQEPIEKRIDETLKFIFTELKNPRLFSLPGDQWEKLVLLQNIEDELKKKIFNDPKLNDILSLSNRQYPNAELTKLMLLVNTLYFKIDHESLDVSGDHYIKILPHSLLEYGSFFMNTALKSGVINILNPNQDMYFLFNHLHYLKIIQEQMGMYRTLVLGCGRFKKNDWIDRTQDFGRERFPRGLHQYFVSASCTDPHNRDLTVARMPHIMPHIVADIRNEYFIDQLTASGLKFDLIIDEIGILENDPALKSAYEQLLRAGGRIRR